MKHSSFLYMLSLVLASAVCSCSETDTADDIVVAREFTGISAGIASSDVGGSRAAVEKEPLYIGRQDFKGSDEIVMTSFHRTENKVDDYSYTDVIWVKADGDGGWTRSAYDTNGKIYWSDSENEHTIAGFSIPQNMPADRWVKSYDGYAGQLHLSGETGKVVYDTRDSFVDDDLLLTYDTSIRPDATGIATIFFRHALSCLTIDVNIQGFSSTPGMGLEEKDNASRVKSLVVRDQPYKYIWHEDAAGVTVSDEATSVADIVAWTNNPDGEGTGSSRRFYFHTLEVPGTRTQMVFDFEVSYPDPLNPANTLTNTYRATADNIEFVAGKRTTIKITLDHEKEKITVGAVYEDWIFIETPDAGNLAKNSTYLESTDMSGIRLHTDVGLTADDATWLYISSDDSSVLDIYGNDGSEENPYIISTAEQLLAFAGEVNTGAMDFSGRFVRLDASLYMQPTITSTSVDWIGIGSVTHPFKGSFEGGLRTISYLKGSSLFGYVGEGAVVEGVCLTRMLGTTDGGSVAAVNEGTIVGCMVNGDVTGTDVAGGICRKNTGSVIACAHIGNVTADGSGETVAGGIAGENSSEGVIAASYVAGDIKAVQTSPQCYYNSDLHAGDYGESVQAMTTMEMIVRSFVETLNTDISNAPACSSVRNYRFIYQPSEYPAVDIAP